MPTDKKPVPRAKFRKVGRPSRIKHFSLRTAPREVRTVYNRLYRFFYRWHPDYKHNDPKAPDALDLVRYVHDHQAEILRATANGESWPYPKKFKGWKKNGERVTIDLTPYLTNKRRATRQQSKRSRTENNNTK